MALKISDTWLKKQAAPASGAMTFWDSEITGFGVRIFAPTKRHATGARSFFVNYRVGGREKRFTVGSYPDWSAEAARGEAKELRRRIDRGEDPANERKTRREAPTVRDLAYRYKEEHLPKKAESSQANDWAMVENEILPAIGDRKVADVHEGDIEALHRGITERGSGRPGEPCPRGRLENVLTRTQAEGRRGRPVAGSGAGQSLQGRRPQP